MLTEKQKEYIFTFYFSFTLIQTEHYKFTTDEVFTFYFSFTLIVELYIRAGKKYTNLHSTLVLL